MNSKFLQLTNKYHLQKQIAQLHPCLPRFYRYNMSHSYPVEEFHFPTIPIRYRTIKNLHHFHELLKEEHATLRRDVRFESMIIPNPDGSETLNVTCKNCQTFFFKYMSPHKGENFYLKEYSEKHQHVLKQNVNFHQSIIERIQNFLAQDDRQDKQELCQDICSNYRITTKQFEQLYSQAGERMKRNTLLYDGKEIEDLIRKLRGERYTVLDDSVKSRVERQAKNITKSIVIYNEQMSINYKRYGECCYIAIDDRHQVNRWYVGAFLGVGRDMELIVFGVFLLKSVDADHLKGLIKMYLGSVEVKPLTIITQLSYYFQTALAELKHQNFIQSQHLLDYATFSDKLHQKNSKYKRIFAELYSEPEKRVFFEKLGDIYRGDSFSQLDLDLEELVRLSGRVCLSQIPKVPVGPYRVIKNKVTQKRSDYSVLRQFPKFLYERQCFAGKHLYAKIKNLLVLLLHPVNQEIAEKSRIMDIIPELRAIQPHIAKNVMEYLISKCLSTLHLRVEKVDELNYKVFNGRSDYLQVFRKEDKAIWLCECQESIKTKLPCIHELCVCIKFNHPIEAQIGKRWTNELQRIQEENRRKMHKKNKWRRTTLSEFLA